MSQSTILSHAFSSSQSTLYQAATALAKQLIQLRKQKTRNVSAKTQLGSISHQAAV
jgi:uncharacterized protein YukE